MADVRNERIPPGWGLDSDGRVSREEVLINVIEPGLGRLRRVAIQAAYTQNTRAPTSQHYRMVAVVMIVVFICRYSMHNTIIKVSCDVGLR